MKRKTLAIAAALSTMSCFSQTDTICEMVSGKYHFKFDYNTSEIIEKNKYRKYKKVDIKIEPNQFLYLDLLDKDTKLLLKRRKITIYFTNNTYEVTYLRSKENMSIEFDGKEVEKITVHKPLM